MKWLFHYNNKMINQEKIVEINKLIRETGDAILANNKPLTVTQKTSASDVVTNIDKESEKSLVAKIAELNPNAKIISEETPFDSEMDLSGEVFVVDPLDGTLNFVLEHDNFGIMIGLYVDGKPAFGWIYDVVAGNLFYGGPEFGVYKNDVQIFNNDVKKLNEGILLISWHSYKYRSKQQEPVVNAALNIRVFGSASISIIRLLEGRASGYLSDLMPWDFAAGYALALAFGFKVSSIDGNEINILKSNQLIIGNPNFVEDVLKLNN
jgi:myo-inositol-1(or 4)-monophosphatase